MVKTYGVQFWESRYQYVSSHFEKDIKKLSDIFIAFKTNMDAIEHVTPALLKQFNIDDFKLKQNANEINSLDDFKTGLITSMKLGKAMEWVIQDIKTYNSLIEEIKYDSYRIGGQAGIVANLLVHLGMKNVMVYNPKISEAEADMYDGQVKAINVSGNSFKIIKAKDAHSINDTPKINLIFEYLKGTEIKTKNDVFVVPRTNRFIVSYRPAGREPFFDDACLSNMGQVLNKMKYAFLSGYQMLSTDDEFFKAKVQLGLMKKANPDMKIHFEFTSEEDLLKVSKIIKYILPEVDSLGCNERETCILLDAMDKKILSQKIRKSNYGAVELYEGLKYIKNKTKLNRFHVHNINYMLCLSNKDYAEPEKTRDALILCIESAFAKGVKGFIHHAIDLELSNDIPTNPIGIKQISKMDEYMIRKIDEGIYVSGKNYLVMVPTKVGGHVKATVGLGDTVSSTAFICGHL